MNKFIKNGTRMVVISITIILIIIIGMSIGGRTRVTGLENLLGKMIVPIQKIFYKSGHAVENTLYSIFAFKKIEQENQLLKDEIKNLNQQLIEATLTRNELNDLKSLSKNLNYVKSLQEYDYITASVTGMNTEDWFNIFLIDAGKKQGIVKNSIVLNGEGLIGKVLEAGDDWAKVISIIDNKSSVSFEVLRNSQYIGIIRGNLKGELTGYLIDPQAEVIVGDKLITSGLSNYPKGILIGEIKEIIQEEDELLKTIIVVPAVNFKKIDKVIVLTPKI